MPGNMARLGVIKMKDWLIFLLIILAVVGFFILIFGLRGIFKMSLCKEFGINKIFECAIKAAHLEVIQIK